MLVVFKREKIYDNTRNLPVTKLTMDFIWDALADEGVTYQQIELIKNSYLLLMMLPIVSTLVGIGRHVVGIKTLSVYAPIVTTFAFYEISTDALNSGTEPDVLKGLKLGLLLFSTAFFTSALLYYFVVKQLRMHYIPKSTLVVTGVSISVISLMIFGAFIGELGLVFISFFTLVMIASLSERFMATFAKKNFRYSFIVSLETLLLSVISFILITWQELQDALLDYPWLIILVIIINIFLGTFSGLRLTEYWRFRDVINKE